MLYRFLSRSSLLTEAHTARRAHSDPQVVAQLASLHALLLTASPTRALASQHTIQHILQTIKHLSIGVPISDQEADTAGSPELGSSATAPSAASDSGEGGLHGQLASIGSAIAALDQAVTVHQDAAVALTLWQQLVQLAAPTGWLYLALWR